MNEMLHRFFATTMALLLLASTTSWTVGKHYCMGHLMDISFFVQAENCGMNMTVSDDETPAGETENSCCDDEIITIEGQDSLKLSFEELDLDQQLFLVAFTHTYLNVFNIRSERQLPNEYYPPPLLVKDIQLLDEVFLI